jgi:hypothetical protein
MIGGQFQNRGSLDMSLLAVSRSHFASQKFLNDTLNTFGLGERVVA